MTMGTEKEGASEGLFPGQDTSTSLWCFLSHPLSLQRLELLSLCFGVDSFANGSQLNKAHTLGKEL